MARIQLKSSSWIWACMTTALSGASVDMTASEFLGPPTNCFASQTISQGGGASLNLANACTGQYAQGNLSVSAGAGGFSALGYVRTQSPFIPPYTYVDVGGTFRVTTMDSQSLLYTGFDGAGVLTIDYRFSGAATFYLGGGADFSFSVNGIGPMPGPCEIDLGQGYSFRCTDRLHDYTDVIVSVPFTFGVPFTVNEQYDLYFGSGPGDGQASVQVNAEIAGYSVTSVPEPSTSVLLFAVSAGWLLRKRASRHGLLSDWRATSRTRLR